MTTYDALMKEVRTIPEPLLRELLDFARFLKSKGGQERYETALASEQALGRDWLRPEEDAAWESL